MKIRLLLLSIAVGCLGITACQAADRQPVSKVITGYTLEEAEAMEAAVSLQTMLKGGDISLFANTRLAEFFHTTVIPRRAPFRDLASQINPAVGKVMAETSYGNLSLDDFLASPRSFVQGFIVVHHGKVVFESYPGMKPADSHLWASCAKPLVGIILEQLIDEGLLDPHKTYGDYMPDFRGTAWEKVPVIDIMNMASGLDVLENDQTRGDPTSIATRLFISEFGQPDPVTHKVETTRDILKAATKQIEPGQRFDYASANTQSLVLLVEQITQKRFATVLDERVLSHVALAGDLQMHLSGADRLALSHGIVSSPLRDLAIFGMLFTPSWNKVSDKQVVSAAALERIQKHTPPHAVYMAGSDGPLFMDALADNVISNNHQWDDIFPDGDFFKLGFMGQGLYVSPSRDLVIAYFSTNPEEAPGERYMRPIARSGLFDK